MYVCHWAKCLHKIYHLKIYEMFSIAKYIHIIIQHSPVLFSFGTVMDSSRN